ncbi:MAG: hypothetical protein JNG90_02540, partial [Planctomycetaceae bacterium]|nr:hypothetical protein [Planctomycetaceae bacterium]
MLSLREFLRELSIDSYKLGEFIRDPRGSMETGELEDQGRRVLASGSASLMWNHLLGRATDAADPVERVVETDRRGTLTVIGTGIRTVGQLTLESLAWIRESDAVYYLVADPIAEEVIKHLQPEGAISLMKHYGEGTYRGDAYEGMIQEILASVRSGKKTCAAFYGHPGVFAFPSHESVRRARSEGYTARMLPAISAEDCLYADLGIDPAINGCQSYEATDFVLYDRQVDSTSQLILWQVGVVGDRAYRSTSYQVGGVFPLLIARLSQFYGAEHVATIYEAAVLPGLPPSIRP